MNRHRMLLVLLAASSVALAAGQARATTVRHQDTRGLVKGSSEIVIGKVTSVRSHWNDQRTKIYTAVEVEVSRTLKGGGPGRLTLTQLGGEVDGMRYAVPGCPAFRPGEEALLFVWRDAAGRAQVNGLAQGKFEIERDPATGRATVQRALPGLGVRDARSLRLVEQGQPAPRLPLEEMVAEIERVLAEEGR